MKRRFSILYLCILTVFTVCVLLKTFVIPDANSQAVYSTGVYSQSAQTSGAANTQAADSSDSNSYKDDNISISITAERVDDTTVYIADVQVSSVAYLKTAFAKATYGRNIKETTSDMAADNNAILAVNGDYYGFRDYGYVIRNGVLYRDTYGDADDESFVVYEDGSCDIITESEISAQKLLDNGAVQVLSFGPGLVEDGTITVSKSAEVDQAKTSNPRTAIGMISPLHYLLVVSDGRNSESQGLTLYQLAGLMKDAGCTEAYNLDGGGSSTLWFKGQIINTTVGGNGSSERKVSDIVYIG